MHARIGTWTCEGCNARCSATEDMWRLQGTRCRMRSRSLPRRHVLPPHRRANLCLVQARALWCDGAGATTRGHNLSGCHARADSLSGLIKHSFGHSLHARTSKRSCVSCNARNSVTEDVWRLQGTRGNAGFVLPTASLAGTSSSNCAWRRPGPHALFRLRSGSAPSRGPRRPAPHARSGRRDVHGHNGGVAEGRLVTGRLARGLGAVGARRRRGAVRRRGAMRRRGARRRRASGRRCGEGVAREVDGAVAEEELPEALGVALLAEVGARVVPDATQPPQQQPAASEPLLKARVQPRRCARCARGAWGVRTQRARRTRERHGGRAGAGGEPRLWRPRWTRERRVWRPRCGARAARADGACVRGRPRGARGRALGARRVWRARCARAGGAHAGGARRRTRCGARVARAALHTRAAREGARAVHCARRVGGARVTPKLRARAAREGCSRGRRARAARTGACAAHGARRAGPGRRARGAHTTHVGGARACMRAVHAARRAGGTHAAPALRARRAAHASRAARGARRAGAR